MRIATIGALAAVLLFLGLGCKGNLKSSDCTPDCSGKSCGDDGCGGTCGTCKPGEECEDASGLCVSIFCGNGRIDGEEKCDFGIATGAGGACPAPTDCVDDGNACTNEQHFGNPTACTAECKQFTIADCINGDGCCPSGCNTNDSDCSDSCDDGVIDPDETCDPLATCPRDPATDCPDDMDACTTAILTGNPDACASACAVETIDECIDDDGCCALGCTPENDSDCEGCGDGVLVDPEMCDFAIPDGMPGACPMDPAICADADDCTTDEIQGAADNCSAVCANTPIVMPINDDNCCPPGATPGNDNDCMAVCGNQILEAGEVCDNAIVAGNDGYCPLDVAECDDMDACTTDDLLGMAADCTAECVSTDVMMPVAADGCCYFAGTVAQEITDCQSLCDQFCTMATTFCVDYDGAGTSLYNDDNASGDAMDECQADCAQFGYTIRQAGTVDFVDDDGFNTLYCRLYHLGLADPNVDAMGPMTHCPHAVELLNPVCNTDP